MQLRISHKLNIPLVLPLSYHHIQQSIIYRSLEDENMYSTKLHDEGYNFGERAYRMFTFSQLKGKYEIEGKKIIFRDSISFEVRSPEVTLIKLLKHNIEQRGIEYIGQHYDHVSCEIDDKTIIQDTLYIRMVSPICVYSTIDEDQTYYYRPDEEEFYHIVNENAQRKYLAYTQVPMASAVRLEPIKVTQKDKYVTKYKGIYIGGWRGTYKLMGEPKYLDFLYQTGIGSKNSQGFGMFEINEKV